jgi:hypothetical protein
VAVARKLAPTPSPSEAQIRALVEGIDGVLTGVDVNTAFSAGTTWLINAVLTCDTLNGRAFPYKQVFAAMGREIERQRSARGKQ